MISFYQVPSLLLVIGIVACCLHVSIAMDKDDETFCLSKSEISSRLDSETRPSRRVVRVTIPATASTKIRSDMPTVLGKSVARYSSAVCDTLCFTSSSDENDPFVSLEFNAMNDGHYPYDTVISRFNRDGASYMLTTVRNPVQYAHKFYRVRKHFDSPSKEIHDLTFREWLHKSPWRTNQMTRMLGRENNNELVMIKSIDPPSMADEYMTEQNALGEDSPVLQMAWKRLSENFLWYGLFHRLKESIELLAFTTCVDPDLLTKSYHDRALKQGTAQISSGNGFPEEESEREELLKEVLDLNRLDTILLERAEILFNERFEEMKAAKARGVICNFAGTVEVTCENEDKKEL